MLYVAAVAAVAVADKKVNAITKTQWRMQCTRKTSQKQVAT